MLKKIVLGLFIAAFFSGCLKNEDQTCNYDPCAYKASTTDIQTVQQYLTDHTITATQHCSGLFYVIDSAGTGKAPTVCSGVNVTYVGKLPDNTVFDQGTINLPLNQVIRGWANGIPLIKEGGTIHLYIPASLGYGNTPPTGSSIPPNSMLIFDVTLHSVF